MSSISSSPLWREVSAADAEVAAILGSVRQAGESDDTTQLTREFQLLSVAATTERGRSTASAISAFILTPEFAEEEDEDHRLSPAYRQQVADLELDEEQVGDRSFEIVILNSLIKSAPDSINELEHFFKDYAKSGRVEVQLIDRAISEEVHDKMRKCRGALARGRFKAMVVESAQGILRDIRKVPLDPSGPVPYEPIPRCVGRDRFGKPVFQDKYYSYMWKRQNFMNDLAHQRSDRKKAYFEMAVRDSNKEWDKEFDEFYFQNESQFEAEVEPQWAAEEVIKSVFAAKP